MKEIRCPVHGFIQLNELEWEIINTPEFQRLRRIKQLAFTDFVYPGAMHTRFEHSLGVMHVVGKMMDSIYQNNKSFLEENRYNADKIKRIRALLRLTALLHDIGHSPFSHAGEELFKSPYKHEDYSIAIINSKFNDLLKSSKDNDFEIQVEEVSDLLSGKTTKSTLFKPLISGQIDADRSDYFLRDSYHLGVEYGKFDLERLINTLRVFKTSLEEEEALVIGFDDSGYHVAESFVIARYMLFTQVYFHKTRLIYNFHLQEAMKSMLEKGVFPEPIEKGIDEYLDWDDWKVYGKLKESDNIHAKIILQRNHWREVYSKELITEVEKGVKNKAEELRGILNEKIGQKNYYLDISKKKWFKGQEDKIFIKHENSTTNVDALDDISHLVKGLEKNTAKISIFVDNKDRKKVKELLEGM